MDKRQRVSTTGIGFAMCAVAALSTISVRAMAQSAEPVVPITPLPAPGAAQPQPPIPAQPQPPIPAQPMPTGAAEPIPYPSTAPPPSLRYPEAPPLPPRGQPLPAPAPRSHHARRPPTDNTETETDADRARANRPDPEATLFAPSAITGETGSWEVSIRPLLLEFGYSPARRLRLRLSSLLVPGIFSDSDALPIIPVLTLSATIALVDLPRYKLAAHAQVSPDKDAGMWTTLGSVLTACTTPQCHHSLSLGFKVALPDTSQSVLDFPDLLLFVSGNTRISKHVHVVAEYYAGRFGGLYAESHTTGIAALRVSGSAYRGTIDLGAMYLSAETTILPYLGWTLRSR